MSTKPSPAAPPPDDEHRKHPPSTEENPEAVEREGGRVEHRRLLRGRIEDASRFVAESGAEKGAIGKLEGRTFPFSGSLFVAVHTRYVNEPLRDPEARIGVCDVHPLPADVPAEENPCPFQLCDFYVATSAAELRQAICEEMLLASPDLSPREIRRTIEAKWRIVALEADAVICGWFFDDRAFPGGEPQLRHDGQQLANRGSPAWTRVREMLEDDVAMMILGGDPEGTGRAQHMLLFVIPGLALTKERALRWGPARTFGELEGWRGFRRAVRRAKVPAPARRSRIRTAASEALFRWRTRRANHAAARAERRGRRDRRRLESAERWSVRSKIAAGLRDWLLLIREIAETAIVVGIAVAIVASIVASLPAAGYLAWRLLEHWH